MTKVDKNVFHLLQMKVRRGTTKRNKKKIIKKGNNFSFTKIP